MKKLEDEVTVMLSDGEASFLLTSMLVEPKNGSPKSLVSELELPETVLLQDLPTFIEGLQRAQVRLAELEVEARKEFEVG